MFPNQGIDYFIMRPLYPTTVACSFYLGISSPISGQGLALRDFFAKEGWLFVNAPPSPASKKPTPRLNLLVTGGEFCVTGNVNIHLDLPFTFFFGYRLNPGNYLTFVISRLRDRKLFGDFASSVILVKSMPNTR